MQTPQTECQALINAILPFAEKMLREKGEFLPYGGALLPNGKITLIGTGDFGVDYRPNEMIGLLKQALKKGAASGEYRATALVQDARVSVPTSVEKYDVIAIAVDHRNNVSINIVFPYQLSDGIVTLGKSVTQQAANDVFPRLDVEQEDEKPASGIGFTAGTRVHTKTGLKTIESVQIGDLVLSHPQNEPPPLRRRQKEEYSYRKVTKVAVVDNQPIANVTYLNHADGIKETLRVACNHPVWTKGVNWIAAGQLKTGDALVLSFNGNAMVTKVETSGPAERVYNLGVEEFQTFYVEQLGAWVHCDRSVAKPQNAEPQPKVPFDFNKPQVLLEIAGYCNYPLTEPEGPRILPDEQVEKFRQAAEQMKSIALEHMQITLNYDLEGVRWMTGYIDRMRVQRDPKDRQGSTNMLGVFLGECLIRNFGGQWAIHDNMYCVLFDDKSAAFPFNKVAKQFENGTAGGDSILGLYENVAAMRKVSAPLTPGQERLLKFYRSGGNRIFVLSYINKKHEWHEIEGVVDGWVKIQQGTSTTPVISVPLTQIVSYYVCAEDGKLIHTEWIDKAYFASLPEEILRQIQRKLPTDTSLTIDQTESGNKFIAIEYAKSNVTKEGYHCYATSLRNISNQKIKILKFGGLRFNGAVWTLASVTSQYYTADNFKDWYQQKGEWLLPGETACDASNWGKPPVLWAYYGVTESGESFISGKCIEQPFEGAADEPLTSTRTTTDRNHPGLNDRPEGGQNSAYLVLSEDERSKGFVRPVRKSYIHKCGGKTTVSLAICESYARNPKLYSHTFCFACDKHFPVSEFKWAEDGMEVGS